MKRSIDLVRKILLAMNKHEDGYAPNNLEIEGYSSEEIGYHCLIMDEAGLIVALESSSIDSLTPSALPVRLTWFGHEFLDSAKNENIWNQANQVISKAGDVSFSVWSGVLTQVVKQNLGLGN